MSRNAAITGAVYAGTTGIRGPALSGGVWRATLTDALQRSASPDVRGVLFGVLLALTVMLGAPIG